MKTIRMPQAMLDATLAALRSGKYRQGKGCLETSGWDGQPRGYCCLGVMQMAIEGVTERQNVPSSEWLKRKGITFAYSTYTTLKALVKEHHTDAVPHLPAFGCSAWEANDVRSKTFAEIADAWEDAAEGY